MLEDLSNTNIQLKQEIDEREKAEKELKKAHDELEIRVMERTAEHKKVNEELKIEINERKKAEKDLLESEELYKTLVKTSPDSVTATDIDGHITFISSRTLELHGYKSAEELLGKKAFVLIAPEDRERAMMNLLKTLKESFIRNIEYTLLRKDRTRFIGELNAALIRDAFGKPKTFIATVRDITERKNIEEALKKAHDELEIRVQERTAELAKANEQLRSLTEHLHMVREKERTLIARYIHDELGQSLTALKMDVSWIERNLPEEIDSLREKIKSMYELIDKTLKTTKEIITELRPSILDDFGLKATLEWYAKEFQNRTEINCKIHTDLNESTLEQTRSTTIFRIFQESLTNIARHANATSVKVNVKVEKSNLVLKVEDNGKGITEEQINDSKSLGLIGMRERLIILKGKLKIFGVKDKGTTVVATVPLERREEPR